MRDSFSLLSTVVADFHCWVVYHCTNIPPLPVLLLVEFELLQCVLLWSNVTVNILVHVFLCIMHYSIVYIPGIETAGS